ncbi:hypothetical protein ACHQM5_010390 [Ranunculus cassubicifolius]
MKPPSPSFTAKLISKTLISSSNHSIPTRSWTPSLEQTLHQITPRHSLTPSLVSQIIDPFLLPHHSLALGFFNWASQQPGFIHTSLTYQSILKSLSLSRQFNSVQKLLKQVKSQRIVLHPSIYRSVIASQIIGKKSQTYSAFLIWNDVKELSYEIGFDTCNSLLAGLAAEGYLDCACKVFDEMSVRGVSLSTVGFGVFIGRFCRVKEIGETLRLIDGVKGGVSCVNGSVIAVLIADGLCRESRVMEASKVLEELRVREWKPDFMAYRVVAEGFRIQGEVIEREKVLKRKRKFGVAPRSNDYREFLLNLVSERRILEAKELGEVIVGGNFPIEEDVLNVLIGSVSAIDPDYAIVLNKSLLEKGRFPSLLTLSNLGRNLCRNGKTEELVEVYDVLSSMGYFSDMERYNVMVSFLCTAGRVKEAYGALQEMKKKGFGPDISSYNSVMEACCREDLLRPAKRLWDEMFVNGCSGNSKTYNILIRKFSEVGEVDEAHRLFNHMLEKGVVPDDVSYTSLIGGFCREEKVGTACEIFKMSVEQDTSLAQNILTALIHSLCKEGKYLAASKVIRGLTPNFDNHECHGVLIKALADAGEIETALNHIEWIVSCSPPILQVVSAELVASLSSALKPDPIVQLLRSMMEKGIVSYNESWMDLCDGFSFGRS